MEATLFGIPNLDTYLVIGVLVFFGLLESLSGQLRYSKRKRGDWIQEVGSFFVLAVLIKPGIVLCVLGAGTWLWPDGAGLIGAWRLWIALPFYLLIDDLLQYGYHRLAHENPFLWKLHRTHHQAEEMGFFVSYRNAALYYLMMPNIWWVGAITFLGGGEAVALGLILKQLVIIGAHSTIKWDEPLYRIPGLRPIMRIVERIIITPAFHHAHHGRSKLDGVSDPNGNFGNMFSIWDQLFGTAQFTGQFPQEYGLQRPTADHWSAAYLYPLITAEDPASELSPAFIKSQTAHPAPAVLTLEKGKSYLWCSCGLSKEQPFCDGSHHGTKHKPLLFTSPKDGQVRLCSCKLSQHAPFCDNAHKQWAHPGE